MNDPGVQHGGEVTVDRLEFDNDTWWNRNRSGSCAISWKEQNLDKNIYSGRIKVWL